MVHRHFPQAFGSDHEAGIDREQTLLDLQRKGTENFILGYFVDNELVGQLGFIRRLRKKERHKGTIWGMYVRNDQQGRGIGKALMEATLEKASAIEGLEKILLTVMSPQERALKLYESFGFYIYGREPKSRKVSGEYLDEILLQKEVGR